MGFARLSIYLQLNMYKTQLSRFAIVGISTVLVDYIIYIFMINIFGFSPILKAISFIAGASYAFIFNSLYTFGQGHLKFFQLLKFSFTYALSLGINIFVNTYFISTFSVPSNLSISLAFCLATLASSVVNFILMKFFVYK